MLESGSGYLNGCRGPTLYPYQSNAAFTEVVTLRISLVTTATVPESLGGRLY